MKKLFFILGTILLISCSESTKFRLLDSSQTGLDFQNTITETDSFNILTYEYIYNGAGVGAGDLNNDGLPDLVFAGNQVSSRIYLNQGNFKFRDITGNFNGLTNDQWFSGVALADVNNDGWLDVYLTSTAGRSGQSCLNRLWINGGPDKAGIPAFTEMAEKYGIACDDQSVSAAFFDYDLDGFLDLYVLNNEVNPQVNSTYRKKITDGTALNNDRLYHNNGDGTFSDVTIPAGIIYEGFGMGLAVSDINKDGFPDIYISNDLIANDVLYMNQGNGTFKNEIARYISYQSRTSKGNDIADINNDGNPDIFTLDVLPESYAKKKQTINGFNYLYYTNDEAFGFEHQYLRNMLHLHNEFLDSQLIPFSETGQIAGIFQSDWSWSSLFADYDNDGYKDLLITNGFPHDITDKDWTRLKVMAAGTYASDKLLAEMAPSLKIPNLAFENIGNVKFVKRNNWLPDIPSYSYGAAIADLDNDGDLDYIVNNINDKAFILKNTTVEKSQKSSNYIKIKLKGSKTNPLAIGATIELWSGGKYQSSEHYLTRGYASSVDPVVHFGIAGSKTVDSVRVKWSVTGKISLLKNLKSNQTIEINEEGSIAPVFKVESDKELIFLKCDGVIDYLHQQNDFNDYELDQKILPHKFSQIGPRMAKGDIDNDGQEDIIIGSTSKMPTIVFLKKGNRFEKIQLEGLTTQKEMPESDVAIVDIDNDGDKDVVAVSGGYESTREEDYVHYLYENNNNVFVRKKLPVPTFPASVVRICDFNHDGSPDIFIGGRVKIGMFPFSNHSWVILNEKGKLTADSTFRINLGLVTDAIWTDYDNDGWEDLVVAREWNSLVILRNMKGKELVPQYIPGLEEKHGFWYSLAAGDLDGDGDKDIIAGNMGDNHRFTITNKFPLRIYAVDVDMNGIIDPISTAYWENKDGIMTEYPVNYLDELWSQSKMFEALYDNYTRFSQLAARDILKENILKRVQLELFVNTTSSYILWNEKGSFRFEKLPEIAQFSPVKKMIIEDFNHDNIPDILVAGNDYTWNLSTGYFDANKGLLLVNSGNRQSVEGNPSYKVLGPSKSGILLNGMVESLLYFKGDTSLVIAGINRSSTAVFRIR